MGQVAKDNIEIGVVLQGGGALGAYEYGAMIALLELMDKIDIPGRTVRLTAVTGVSIGAINAACVVGARDRADARGRLRSLWSDLSLDAPSYWWAAASRNLALFGVPGFYTPRRSELRYGNRLRQDRANANTINRLLETIDALAAAVPAGSLDPSLEKRVHDAGRFKILNAITDIDLADPDLMEKAGFPLSSDASGSFRDFSAAGVKRRHDIGYRLTQLKLQELFETHGLLPARH